MSEVPANLCEAANLPVEDVAEVDMDASCSGSPSTEAPSTTIGKCADIHSAKGSTSCVEQYPPVKGSLLEAARVRRKKVMELVLQGFDAPAIAEELHEHPDMIAADMHLIRSNDPAIPVVASRLLLELVSREYVVCSPVQYPNPVNVEDIEKELNKYIGEKSVGMHIPKLLQTKLTARLGGWKSISVLAKLRQDEYFRLEALKQQHLAMRVQALTNLMKMGDEDSGDGSGVDWSTNDSRDGADTDSEE